MNRTFISGRLAKEIELRKTESGKDIIHVSIALNKKDSVEYFDITAFDQQAKYLSSYAKKGDFIQLECHLTNRAFEKDGKKQYKLTIIADSVEIVSKKINGVEFRGIEETEQLEVEGE